MGSAGDPGVQRMSPAVDPLSLADHQRRCGRKFPYSTRAHAKAALRSMRAAGLDSPTNPLTVYRCVGSANGFLLDHWHVGHRPS